MRRKQEAGPGRSSSGRASSPLFTEVRGIGILRTSPLRGSRKLYGPVAFFAPVQAPAGPVAPSRPSGSSPAGGAFAESTAPLRAGRLPNRYRAPPARIVGTSPISEPNKPPTSEPRPRAP